MSRKKYQKLGTILGLGRRLRKIRGAQSQEGFGRQYFGLGKSTISKFESDDMIPDFETLEIYAQLGKTTVERLLRGESVPTQAQFRERPPEDYAAGLSDLEAALLTEVLLKVEEVIKARRLKLTLAQKVRLIVKTYDDCRAAHEHPSITHVERILLLRD